MSQPAPTDTKKHEIFFSYAWGEKREKIVDALYESLAKDDAFQPIRDKVNAGYRENIQDFMERIGKGSFVVIALSKKYILSEFCMYELYELYRNSNSDLKLLQQKIYPVRIESLALNDPEVIGSYIIYWTEKVAKWEALVKNLSTLVGLAQHGEYRKMKAIANNIGDLLNLLHYLNALTNNFLSANNFETIKEAIKTKAKEIGEKSEKSGSLQKVNQSSIVPKTENMQLVVRFADYEAVLSTYSLDIEISLLIQMKFAQKLIEIVKQFAQETKDGGLNFKGLEFSFVTKKNNSKAWICTNITEHKFTLDEAEKNGYICPICSFGDGILKNVNETIARSPSINISEKVVAKVSNSEMWICSNVNEHKFTALEAEENSYFCSVCPFGDGILIHQNMFQSTNINIHEQVIATIDSSKVWICSNVPKHRFSTEEAERNGYFCSICSFGDGILICENASGSTNIPEDVIAKIDSDEMWICSNIPEHRFSAKEAEKNGYFCTICPLGEGILIHEISSS